MKYDFDEIINRKNTGSVKWDFGDWLIQTGMAEQFNQDTISMCMADMDIAAPPSVINALHRTADTRIFGYTKAPKEYYDAVIGWFKRRHGWEIKQDEIVYCNRSLNAIAVAVKAFTEPGDGVIIQRPVYAPFSRQIISNNRVVVNNQLISDNKGHYNINFVELEQLAQEKNNKLFILCNPQNPTGRVFTEDEISKIYKICSNNNVIMLADEIHGDLIRKDSFFVPAAKVCGENNDIITFTSVNKTFNLAGLHISNIIIGNKDLREKFEKNLGAESPTPFAYNATIAAYNECEDWVEEINKYFDTTIEWVLEFIKTRMPKLKCVRPEGTYLMWLDFRKYGLSSEELRKRIYVDANVVLEGGSLFDPEKGDGFERICVSAPKKVVSEAFLRLSMAFEDIK